MSSPKLLYIDIENFPIIGAVWEMYEANVIWVESPSFLASFAATWEGKKTRVYSLPDYHGFRKYTDKDDKPLLKDLWKLLNEADFVCAHNGRRFDVKKINARLAIHGFQPPSPYIVLDTFVIAKGYFKFDSNKLDNLCDILGIGRKVSHQGAKLWRACRDGCQKSWRTMVRYNARDNDLLPPVLKRLRPFAKSLPNLNGASNPTACPACTSHKTQRRGPYITAAGKPTRRFRYQCRDSECGHWYVA